MNDGITAGEIIAELLDRIANQAGTIHDLRMESAEQSGHVLNLSQQVGRLQENNATLEGERDAARSGVETYKKRYEQASADYRNLHKQQASADSAITRLYNDATTALRALRSVCNRHGIAAERKEEWSRVADQLAQALDGADQYVDQIPS
jgi:chromosome segregation ATPase